MWQPMGQDCLPAAAQHRVPATQVCGRQCASDQQQPEQQPLEQHQSDCAELLVLRRWVGGPVVVCLPCCCCLLLLLCFLVDLVCNRQPDCCKSDLQQDFITVKETTGAAKNMHRPCQ
jgi:hypothetical protein